MFWFYSRRRRLRIIQFTHAIFTNFSVFVLLLQLPHIFLDMKLLVFERSSPDLLKMGATSHIFKAIVQHSKRKEQQRRLKLRTRISGESKRKKKAKCSMKRTANLVSGWFDLGRTHWTQKNWTIGYMLDYLQLERNGVELSWVKSFKKKSDM